MPSLVPSLLKCSYLVFDSKFGAEFVGLADIGRNRHLGRNEVHLQQRGENALQLLSPFGRKISYLKLSFGLKDGL